MLFRSDAAENVRKKSLLTESYVSVAGKCLGFYVI